MGRPAGTYMGSKYPPRRSAMEYQCVECGGALKPGGKSVAQRVTGWIAPRSAGGANHIRHQQRYPEFAHVACLEELHLSAKGNQEGLF